MYLPEIFEEKNLEKLYQLIQDYPFATLISHSAEGLEANHLPFHLLRGITLCISRLKTAEKF